MRDSGLGLAIVIILGLVVLLFMLTVLDWKDAHGFEQTSDRLDYSLKFKFYRGLD